MWSQDQSSLDRAAMPSKSAGWPRTYIMPLTELEPPSTRPRTQTSAWPPLASSGLLACIHRWVGSCMTLARPLGMEMKGWLSRGPASIRATLTDGSSLSR
ncbi:hypothetical protein D3C71_1989400 [compost metagenome]